MNKKMYVVCLFFSATLFPNMVLGMNADKQGEIQIDTTTKHLVLPVPKRKKRSTNAKVYIEKIAYLSKKDIDKKIKTSKKLYQEWNKLEEQMGSTQKRRKADV